MTWLSDPVFCDEHKLEPSAIAVKAAVDHSAATTGNRGHIVQPSTTRERERERKRERKKIKKVKEPVACKFVGVWCVWLSENEKHKKAKYVEKQMNDRQESVKPQL